MLLNLRSLVERVVEDVATFIDSRWPRRQRRRPIRLSDVVVNARVQVTGVAGKAQLGTVNVAASACVAVTGVHGHAAIGRVRARGNHTTILEEDEEILLLILLGII